MRAGLAAALIAAMVAFGAAVDLTARSLRAGHHAVHKPSEVAAASLPGTVLSSATATLRTDN